MHNFSAPRGLRSGTRHGVLLHRLQLRRGLMTGPSSPVARTGRGRRGRFGRSLRELTISAVVVVLAFGFTFVVVRQGMSPSTELAPERSAEQPASITLALALTAALNAHDANAVAQLFGDEDAGPTVNADRYAWQQFEIRLWAEQQARASIAVEAHGPVAIDRGAVWDADVYREDWRQVGVNPLRVTNTILMRNDKLADFTSKPADPLAMAQLGRLWRPGSAPERANQPGTCGQSPQHSALVGVQLQTVATRDLRCGTGVQP